MMNQVTILHPNEIGIPDILGQAANHFTNETTFETYRMSLTPSTIKVHTLCLYHFANYLATIGTEGFVPSQNELLSKPDAWNGITYGLVRQFLNYLLVEGFSIGSINVYLSVVKTYCKKAFESGAIPEESFLLIKTVERIGNSNKKARNIDAKRKTEGIPTRRGAKKADWIRLTPVQVGILKYSHNLAIPKGRRDKVIFCLLADMGLRVGEVTGLRINDINMREKLINIYRIKSDRWQTLRMLGDVHEALEDYLKHDAPDRGLILLKASNQPGYLSRVQGISASGLGRQIKIIASRLIDIEISPHDLRHYWATSALMAGSDKGAVQQGGGWKTGAMVDYYVDGNSIANDHIQLLNTPYPT